MPLQKHTDLFCLLDVTYITGQIEDDTLATDSQIDLAEKMNFRKSFQSSVERFMKRYFLATKTVVI